MNACANLVDGNLRSRRLKLNVGELLTIYLVLMAGSLAAFPNKLPQPTHSISIATPTSKALESAQLDEQIALQHLRLSKNTHNERALALAQMEWSRAWAAALGDERHK